MNCDPIARAYRWIEYGAFGKELERRRFRFLPEVCEAKNALVLGDGDGRFVSRLLQTAPAVHVESVDSSGKMLDLARGRAGSDRVTYRRIDARRLVLADDSFDLLVTHFFLDCFDAADLERLVRGVARAVQPGGRWLVSEFRQPESGWRAVWGWIWLRTLYSFFGLATGLETRRLTDHRPMLHACGFEMMRLEESWFGLLASELWVKNLPPMNAK